ncbi:hypothetical protein SteCoe_5031 [Stentor coeruleus]|uniref:Sfi1 spindle body domain-containing protein n=1 Tax=Stentor coeruleus TaxID=5963 RepID=A0A1R2CTG5_9CILI|nr:hypothetical protein SteCoe_5031 [Stentor coeruleus]
MELEHYASLRMKYSKELNQSMSEAAASRPQTGQKQVSFDFTDQMDIRELRNLREKHNLEFERISTPPNPPEEEKEKKHKKRKHREKKEKKKRKKTKRFEILSKPAIEIEFVIEEHDLSASENEESNHFPVITNSHKFSSKNSECSEYSARSKKSKIEEIQNSYNEAKKALENSFKIDSQKSGSKLKEYQSESKSKASEKPLNQSKISENALNQSKTSEILLNQSKTSEILLNQSKTSEILLNQSKISEKILNQSKTSEKILNQSKTSEKNPDPSDKISSKHSEASQNQSKKSFTNENLSQHSKHSHISNASQKSKLSQLEEAKKLLEEMSEGRYSERINKYSSYPQAKDPETSEKSDYKASEKSKKTETKERSPNLPKQKSLGSQKYKIKSEVEESIHSDEEEKVHEESVDFTISDQTPFESLRFSQDLNPKGAFNMYMDKIKQGIYYRLLTPIIQNLNQENSFENPSSPEIPKDIYVEIPKKITYENFISENPEKGSARVRNIEKAELELRTSRSQPLGYDFDESFHSHKSGLNNIENLKNEMVDYHNIEKNGNNDKSIELSEVDHVLSQINIKKQSAEIMGQALERVTLALLATNLCYSYFSIKKHSTSLEEKKQKNQLAIANYEFTQLKKSVFSWKSFTKHKKITNSYAISNYITRWNFIRLYHTFQGLKHVCKAHKQWISEVRSNFLSKKLSIIIQNWALYMRFRHVKICLRLRKCKRVLSSWKNLIDKNKQKNRSAFIHWYLKMVSKSFRSLTWYRSISFKKHWNQQKALKKYQEKIYALVFLSWKHVKALEKASYIPIRICTKTSLTKKNGSLQEKSHFDIKIIKN